MVCCTQGGRYGCCSPGEIQKSTIASTAYALFDEAAWDGDSSLYGFTIDTSTAEKTQIQIPTFDDFGEMPRVFVFDSVLNLFYLLRANFTGPGFNGTEPIYATTADPAKGTSSQILVRGATGLVTGFQYIRQLKMILFATYLWEGGKQTGYNFYHVDPKVGNAILVSSMRYTTDNYVGWFHETSLDGSLVYRLGFQDAAHGIDPGLGLTDISSKTSTTVWYDNFTQPAGLDFYISIDLYGNSFLSLAGDSSGELNIVQWNLQTAPKVLANLGDAHETEFFGPIASCLNHQQTGYFALVVHDGLIPIQTDRWALAVLDLTSGSTSTTPISPWMIAGTDSVAGFGIADS